MPRSPYLLASTVLALGSPAASAQVTPAPDPTPVIQLPTPTPTATPTPVPTPTPSPVPTPGPTPTPTPTASPRPRATPRPRQAVVARPRPAPTTSPTTNATPTPEATPNPVATPAPARAVPPPIETVVLPQARAAWPLWPWLAGAAGLLLLAALLLFRRRSEPVEEVFVADEPPAPAPVAPRARLTIDVRPTRAGLNLLTATVDSEITIANVGDAPALDVRTAVGLQSAHGEADGELADFAAQAIARPATPPFALAPGEERRFRAVAAVPHDAIRTMTAAGRPMFVPLVAVSARYRDGADDRQVAQAFAVGVERVDSAKLAPLWLDVPPRSYDTVAARPQAAALER